jgi:esterase/lipase
LAAEHGGDVEHVWLERSYHVATQDFDRDEINKLAGEFTARVTGG